MPDANVAVTHDNEWASVINEDDAELPPDIEIVRRILRKYRASAANGACLILNTQPNELDTSTSWRLAGDAVCDSCRALRKKCDGAHPACFGCTRRSLPCNYTPIARRGVRRASTLMDSLHLNSPPSSRLIPPDATTPSKKTSKDSWPIFPVYPEPGLLD